MATEVITVKEVTSKLFIELLAFVQNTKEFASEQIPDVLQQLIAWKMGEAIFGVVAGLFLLVIVFFKIIPLAKETKSEIVILWIVGTIVGTVVGISMFVSHTYSLLQLWLAPKIFIIEYLSALVKG